MAQLPCIGLYKPYINLPFGDCAMYFDHGVHVYTPTNAYKIPPFPPPFDLRKNSIPHLMSTPAEAMALVTEATTPGFHHPQVTEVMKFHWGNYD